MILLSQRQLPPDLFSVLEGSLGYHPDRDCFGGGEGPGGLRVEGRTESGDWGARATLFAPGWRRVPGLSESDRADRDLEDSFLEVAARLPIDFVAWRSGAAIRYDTHSFRHTEERDYAWDYLVSGSGHALAAAFRELTRVAEVRWRKAHRCIGYDARTGRFSDDLVRDVVDAGWGEGTWGRWRESVDGLDAELSVYFRDIRPPSWGGGPSAPG
ncbi:MAG TPA: hypothetical protein VGN26_21570 [Armatimonadota bacterium]